MISNGHKKHADLQKPKSGKFHRNEFAIIGAPCDVIQQLSKSIAENLKEYKIGYADAAHGAPMTKTAFHRTYTDKIGLHSVDFSDEHINYNFKSLFNDVDAAIINGNHFPGAHQIVIINQKKKESLQKKLDRLTDVWFFILDEGESEIYDYLVAHNHDYKKLPVFKMAEVANIAKAIKKQLLADPPKVKGLVLTGGKSTRMGHDKGEIDYHGKPQREYMADMLNEFCEETYLSVREVHAITSNYPLIEDSFTGLGPYGGILSAFRSDPDAAWLVVATDIPLLTKDTIGHLVENRDFTKMATCFHNPETGFPEPLITIWEPRAYSRLLMFLSMGYSCPRKVLINSDIDELALDNTDPLYNANTPEDKEEVLGRLNK